MRNYKFLLWLLPIFSGIFLILSYPFFNFAVLPFFSLLPLFFFLDRKEVSLKKSFLAGFFTGFIFFSWVMGWFFEVITAAITTAKGEFLNYLLLILIWLISSFFLALFLGFFTAGYFLLKKHKVWNIFLMPSLWITLEYLRAWAFGFLWAGREYLSGPHWTFGNLAYTLAPNSVFRFLSSIGGIYLIGFLVVAINYILFFWLRDLLKIKDTMKNWRFLAILAVLLLIIASYFFILPQGKNLGNQSFEVAIVQIKFISYFNSTNETAKKMFATQNQLLEKISQHRPVVDVIILPEGSSFLREEEAMDILSDYFQNKDVLIIDSGENKMKKFVGSFYSTKRGILAEYEKIFLAPFYDYLPYIFESIVKFISQEKLEEFKKFKDREQGKELVVVPITGIGNIGLLFCSESLSPNLHRELAEKGSQVFFNAGSLIFASGSKNLDSQTLAMLQFRAAENGRYMVRSTNYGTSYIIDQRGKIIEKTSNLDSQILFGEVMSIVSKTFYTQFGDWILLIACFLLSAFLLVHVIIK